MRRVIASLFGVALLVGLMPATASAHKTAGDLKITAVKAPVAPDGTTAGAALDFVVGFVDPDPAVPGVGMKAGGTIVVEVDSAFDLTGNQGAFPSGPVPPVVLLQGWPQSPRVTFPYTTSIVGNTITLTLTEDWAVGDFGPGPKSVHLILLASDNPDEPGRYDVNVSVRPDPASAAQLTGHGHVKIIPKVRPSVNVVSLFSGPPGPPPPFFNPSYQDVDLGDPGRRVGMYLWERGGSAALGVDLVMTNRNHGRLVQDGRTVGHVRVKTPKGARNHTLTSEGPSIEIPAFVTGVPTGLLLTQFTPDPAVAGQYKVVFRLNGGNKQVMRYNVSG